MSSTTSSAGRPDAAAERDRYTLGVDFGTLSGRAVVVRVRDGEVLASAVTEYPQGVISTALPAADGQPPVVLPHDWALQHPDDWREVLRTAVPRAVASAGVDPADIVAIATDFTACTVLPTLADGTPLCELPDLASRPHAWPKLWKHHAAQPQADRISALAHERGEPWIDRYGGRISSEWEYAKALQVLEEDPATYRAAERWIEAADWIVWELTGVETRNACTAGYKGILQDGRYPGRDYLAELHPDFADFADTRLSTDVSALGSVAGRLTAEAAQLTGLPEGIVVAVGNVDAHVTAPAAQAVEAGHLLAVMGTSTCHVVSAPVLAAVPGMCGVVDGGIVAGSYGYEAGQSGVGDILAWWVEHTVPQSYHDEAARREISVHQLLSELTAGDPVGAHGLLALDWMNGNRSILVDHELSGLIVGMTLSTTPEEVYRALVEATAFGSRRIVDAFTEAGIDIVEYVVAGGLTRNPFLMQTYADVLGRPLSVAGSDQGPAVGSAIHAAVAAGCYPDVPTAAKAMGRVHHDVYVPHPQRVREYDALYREYVRLHDYFGRSEQDGGNEVMHRLRARRGQVDA